MSTEREQALERWRQGKAQDEQEPEEHEEPRKPVIHFFAPEQEKRFGVGPNEPFNPGNFVSKGVR